MNLSPSAVTVVSGDELRQSGASSLTDALRQVPGIEVQRATSTDSNLSMRGYNDSADADQGVLGLVDGRQVYNDFFGNVLWDALPVDLEEVRQVEVVRGPGSFLYGPNAMHGVVSILTRDPMSYTRDTTSLTTAIGSYSYARAHLTDVRRDGRTGFKTTLSWDDVGQFEDGGDGTRGHLAGELRFALAADDNEKTKDTPRPILDVSLGASTKAFDLVIPVMDFASRMRNDATEVYTRATLRPDDNLRVQLSWTGFDSRSVPDSLLQPFTLDLDTVDIDVQYRIPQDPDDTSELLLGAGYRFSTFRTDDQDIANERHDTGLAWVFGQERATIDDDLELVAGLRCDQHTVTGTILSPRLALVWQFDKPEGAPADADVQKQHGRVQSLRASYGEGFRNPSLREIWFQMPFATGSGSVLGNRDLDPEKIRSFELAWDLRDPSGTSASVSTFYNLVSNLIDFGFQGDNYVPNNQPAERAYGFEVTGEQLLWRHFSAFANYAHSIRTRDHPDATEVPPESKRVSLAPRHKVNAGLRAAFLGDDDTGTTGMLWLHFFDDTELYGTKVPQYTLLNAQIERRFRIGSVGARVFLEGFNLLNDRHREHPKGDLYGARVSIGFGIEW